MKKILALILLISPFLHGCLDVQVSSDYDHGTNFNNYKSYAWLPHTDSVRNLTYDNQIVESNIIRYVNQHLVSLSYTLDTKEPDLLINYHLVVKKQQSTVSTPVYSNQNSNSNFYNNNSYYNNNNYNYNNNYNGNFNNNYNYNYNNNFNRPYSYNNIPYVVGYNTQQVVYDEGTLIIDVIDRKQNKMIWRGWGVSTLTDEASLESDLPAEITKIFKAYPVQPPKDPKDYQDH